MSDSILRTRGINKWFTEPSRFQVLKEVSVDIHKGEFAAIQGKSGSGKSTLMYVMSTMDTDYEGQLYVDNQLLTGRKEHELAAVRNAKLGFVFQFHYLLPDFTVLQNVMLPALKLKKLPYAEVERKAREKLALLDIGEQADKTASKLSGGQQQRVAIARALINEPLIIMGDEPTGNLDSTNSQRVFDILKELARNFGQTIVVVTHDDDFAAKCDRIIELKDGVLLN